MTDLKMNDDIYSNTPNFNYCRRRFVKYLLEEMKISKVALAVHYGLKDHRFLYDEIYSTK